MTSHTLLSDAQEVIGKRWHEGQLPEQARILELARDALRFILATGQRYRFEDFRKSLESGTRPSAKQSREGLGGLEERLSRAEGFFSKLREDEANSAREAEDWLRRHPSPPASANVLIANNYHDVLYDREEGTRRLPRNRDLEYYLAELEQEEPPVPVASFTHLEEAEAWLRAQPEPARWAWVSVAGEPYLAVYHPNIDHRALYPLSMARGYELEKKQQPSAT